MNTKFSLYPYTILMILAAYVQKFEGSLCDSNDEQTKKDRRLIQIQQPSMWTP